MLTERTRSEELVRGVVLVLFGVIVLTVPAGFFTLVLRMLGVVAIIDGALAFVELFRERASGQSHWALVVQGIAGVGGGLITLWWPSLTAFVLLTVLGVWAFVTGGTQFFEALGAEEASTGRKVLGVLRGVVGIAFGLLLLAHPAATGVTMIVVVGFYGIVMGAAQIVSSLVKRRLPAH
jgi:uncharacterized membrane protein HdeD (DUF308 family)